MVRPFAYIGFTMLFAFSVVYYLGEYCALVLWAISLILFVLAMLVKPLAKYRKYLVVISITAIFSCLYSISYSRYITTPEMTAYNGLNTAVEGVVKSDYTSNNTNYYELKITQVNNRPEDFKVLLKSSIQLEVGYGDTISGIFNLSKCENDTYISKGYLYEAQGTSYFLHYNVIKKAEHNFLWYVNYFPLIIKNQLCHNINTLIPDNESGLCNAIAVGDKYGLSSDLYSAFSKTGLTYLIVVSGIHMSIVASFVGVAFIGINKAKRFPITRVTAPRSIVTILSIIAFMVITGCSFSVVRSGIMLIITMFGCTLKRKYDPLNNLGMATIFILAFNFLTGSSAVGFFPNPFVVGDIGWLFSFGATLGILVLNPIILKWFNDNIYPQFKSQKWIVQKFIYKPFRYIFEMMSVSISALIFVIPISITRFGTCNPLVIVTSVFITPVVSILLPLTLLAGVIWLVPVLRIFAYAIGLVMYVLAKAVIAMVDWSAKIPFSVISVSKEFGLWWIVTFAGILLIISLMKNRKRLYKFGVILSYMLLIIGISAKVALNYYDTSIDVIYSGKGTTVALNNQGSKTVLCCGGDMSNRTDVIDTLRGYCSNIDTMIVPSAKSYDSRYSSYILDEFDLDNILLYYKYTTNEKTYRLAKNVKNYREITNNQTVSYNLGNGVTDDVICLQNQSWQYLHSDNKTILIAPYNAKASQLPEKYRKADVLIVSSAISYSDLLTYDSVLWTSSENVPDEFKNPVILRENNVNIKMK